METGVNSCISIEIMYTELESSPNLKREKQIYEIQKGKSLDFATTYLFDFSIAQNIT